MCGQSYWGHGPQYGVIHKQDFTKPGASSIWFDLVDYGVRDSTELLVVIGNNVIEPRSGFRLHKHPSPKLELITSDTGIGFVSWHCKFQVFVFVGRRRGNIHFLTR